MMANFIEPIERLVNAFRALPGVGLKTAQRYAYYIINSDREVAEEFANALISAKDKVRFCSVCGNDTDQEVCNLCKTRDKKIICVVKEPKDIVALEKVKNTNFSYHVLHGTMSPREGRGPDDIRIKELLARLDGVEEVILATNPDVEGEATAMYIARLIKPMGIKVTRIARGLPEGSVIEYADESTLSRALSSRIEL